MPCRKGSFEITKSQFSNLKNRISKSIKTQLKKKNKVKRLKKFANKRAKRINDYFSQDLTNY